MWHAIHDNIQDQKLHSQQGFKVHEVEDNKAHKIQTSQMTALNKIAEQMKTY